MNRRQFLAAATTPFLAGCVAGSGATKDGARPRIERVEVFPIRYPMTGYFKFFAGPDGSTGRAAVVVKITSDDGVMGYGQSVPIAKWSDETLETSTVALQKYFGPALIGRDPEDLVGAHQALDQAIAPGFSTGMPITRAGIDLALHDGMGRRHKKSVPELWGLAAKPKLTLSWTVNVTELAQVEAVMQVGRERGYRHFNIKVGPDPKFDAELAALVRRAAPDGFLWADANGGYTVESALDAAPRLAAAGVDVLEAPLRPNRIRGYQSLRRQAALPILMDEGVISPTDLEEFHALGMLDGVAMKPSRSGGLLSARAQIEYCRQHGLWWLGSGLTDPDLSFAATLQLYAAFGLDRPAALNGPQFLTASILRNPVPVENGEAQVPLGPGLGVAVDEESLRALST